MAGDGAPHAKAISQIAISIGEILGCLVAPIVGAVVGRRPVYFGLCLLSLASCGYMFRAFDSYNMQFVLMAAVVDASQRPSTAGCLCTCRNSSRPAFARRAKVSVSISDASWLPFGALYMGQLVGMFGGSYSRAGAMITLIYALGAVLIWLRPETKGKPLPD